MGGQSWITLGFFFKSCKTNSLGFFFFKKEEIHTHTHTPPPPQKKNPTVQEAVREGSEQDAGEGRKRRQRALWENRGEPALQGTLEMRYSWASLGKRCQ